ncbi:MAG: putative hydrolase, TatD family protein [Streblomastix strix]|uniref:Putative hydrolase, TatD family protein n=1 Tax=Streblomastix strix TaxID=222440 RepID=A0A5J4X193_9EUKA|nr:MAG: putative hydrolase, TatD family protein [Streblomastix strix]
MEMNPDCFGLHPHNSKEYDDKLELRLVEIFAKYRESGKVLAWGEIGLDYHYDFSPRDVQRAVFIRQLKKSNELELPIVLHIREADDDALKIIRENVTDKQKRIHLHCYTSSPPFALQLVQEYPNLFVGFTGVVTFKNSRQIQDTVKALPLDRILLETDAPYMSPIPFRGQTCHSGMIPQTAQKIAELKGVTQDELEKKLYMDDFKCNASSTASQAAELNVIRFNAFDEMNVILFVNNIFSYLIFCSLFAMLYTFHKEPRLGQLFYIF